VFAIASVATDVPMQKIFRGILPSFICIVFSVLLLALFSQIAIYLM
jgi:TRAP-type C4-dicarboxylate transport system permease large subunit